MRNKIIQIIANEFDVPITGFKKRLPEIIGDFDLDFPIKGVKNSNMLLVSGITEEFGKAIFDLILEDILTFEPAHLLCFAYDNSEIYELPIAKPLKALKGLKTKHWLPIVIKKGENFPKDVLKQKWTE